MRIVTAVGTNPLLRRGQSVEPRQLEDAVTWTAAALAPLARDHELVVTHGSRLQLGQLELQADLGISGPLPLDVLDAASEGMVGYLLERELASAVPERSVVALLTRVVVERDDPAFARPSTPVGPLHTGSTARAMRRAYGWTMGRDGSGWRRLVATPEAVDVVPAAAVELLLRRDHVVVCGGGGGVPVVLEHGRTRGVPALVDHDLVAALLAVRIDADALVILTDEPGVRTGSGTADARLVREAPAALLRAMAFAADGIGPRVDALCRFVEATGRVACIGALDHARAVVAGTAGTRVVPHGDDVRHWDEPDAPSAAA